jgi:Lipase (class 3)
MSGFYLAQSTLSTGFVLAEESVRFVDLMFGSNETSRALASIVVLLANELSSEEEKTWSGWLMGGTNTAVLARLTKSATLFACLQHQTFDRTKGELMGRVLWDVSVSSRENEDLAATTISQRIEEPIDEIIHLPLEPPSPTAEQLDAIDLTDAMTIIDPEEYEDVISALPQSSIPDSSSTAFYEVTTETTVTKATTVQYLNSTHCDSLPTETRRLQSRQASTTTEKSKYKIAIQNMSDRLKVKKLRKPSGPKITDITSEDENQISNFAQRAFSAAKLKFSPGSRRGIAQPKRQETSAPAIAVLDFPVKHPPGELSAPPISARDTKANILRTQAQTKTSEPRSTQLIQRPQRNPPHPPPPRTRDVPSPSKLRRRRGSAASISSYISLRSESLQHASIAEHYASQRHNFPPCHLAENLARFMRFSSASYGWNFMRLLGIGTFTDSKVPVNSLHHANHHAFAQHTQLPLSNILLSSFSSSGTDTQAAPLVHFVSVDHEVGAVVLTCRGTLGLADLLTDLVCDYENINVKGSVYSVHKGILRCAKQLSRPTSQICTVIKEALESHPGYGLVLCGHSLVSPRGEGADVGWRGGCVAGYSMGMYDGGLCCFDGDPISPIDGIRY